MPGGSVVSAIPDNLINYGIRATLLDGKVSAQATVLGQALSAFINSNPDPKYIPSIPRLDQNVSSLASSAKGTDSWVGRVGEAFRVAAQQEVAFLGRHTGTTGLNPGTMPTTSTQGQISAWAAGMGSAFQQDLKNYVAHQQYAQGQRDAKALVDAFNGGQSDAELQAIVQRLKGHLGDQSYLAGYFNLLGPKATLELPRSLQGGKGLFPPLPPGNPLQTFDRAFADATHSPLLSPSFLTGVFPSQSSQSWSARSNYVQTLPDSTLLLRYGTYSKPFLAQALQTIVMPFMNDTPSNTLVFDARLDPDAAQRNYYVLEALSRNPVADAQILSSQYTFTEGGQTFRGTSNIAILLKSYGMYDMSAASNPGAPGLSDAIGKITNGASTAEQINALQSIGSVKWQDLPDAVRPAITRVLTHNIGNPAFIQQEKPVKGKDSSQLTWQEQLFIAATTNANGSIDTAGLKALTTAVHDWVKQHPMPNATDVLNGKRPLQLVDWEHQYGTLVGLLNLGNVAGQYKSAADRQAAFSAFTSLLGDLETVFPPSKLVGLAGGKEAAQTIFSLILNHAQPAVLNKLAPTFKIANDNSLKVWKQTSAKARTLLTGQVILGNPTLMPPALAHAYEQNPNDPQTKEQISQYISKVAGATQSSDLGLPPGATDPRSEGLGAIIEANEALQGEIDPEFKITFN